MIKAEDKSKIQSSISDLNGLKTRDPQESKFKEWKDKAEKNVEEVFGKGSDQVSRFRSLKFFDFSRRAGPKDTPLREEERAGYIKGLEDARRLLSRFIEG